MRMLVWAIGIARDCRRIMSITAFPTPSPLQRRDRSSSPRMWVPSTSIYVWVETEVGRTMVQRPPPPLHRVRRRQRGRLRSTSVPCRPCLPIRMKAPCAALRKCRQRQVSGHRSGLKFMLAARQIAPPTRPTFRYHGGRDCGDGKVAWHGHRA